MTNSTQNKVLVLTLASIAILGMIGCSSGSSGGSSGSASGSSYITSLNGYNVTNCSYRSLLTSNGSTFTVRSEAYNSGGYLNTNLIRVHIDALPSDFNTSTGFIAFWTYTLDSNGNAQGEQMMPFTLESYYGNGTFTTLTTNPQTEYNVSGTSVTGLDFVVNMANNSAAHVIQVSLYATSSSTTTQHQVEMLIPAFYANPSVYAQSHTTAETAVHPLYGQSLGSDNAYGTAAAQFCF